MSSVYRFGPFDVNSRRRTLARAGSAVPLTSKAFDVLLFLVQNPNRLVTKEELLQAVWGDRFVEEGNLTQYISHLRKALGDNADDTRLIVTIARKGYQFTANVSVADETEAVQGVHAAGIDNVRDDVRPVQEPPAEKVVPTARGRSRMGAALAAAALVAAAGTYMSWRYVASATPPASSRIMLAVLPFKNLTGDPQKEYLADGLTEETISQLGRLNPEQLGVIARTSVMGYKDKDVRLDQIGRDLSVHYVLENSLRESSGQLRLTAQLIRVKDQTHAWSQDYDYAGGDVLSVEREVARAVAQEIRLRLTPHKRAELARPLAVDPQAFDAYLQGHYFFQRNTEKDDDMAAKYYERATRLDPSYAPAWVGLSRIRKWQAVRGRIPTEEGYRSAREAVERALALNPNLAEAHLQVGRIKQQVDFDWAGADASVRRAIALEPGNLEGVTMAAGSAALLGRFDEAFQFNRRAIDLDPLNGGTWFGLAEIEFYMGRLDEARTHCSKALELNPDTFGGAYRLAEIYILQGRARDALPEIERVSYEPFRANLYPIAYYALGRKADSDAALNTLIAKHDANSAYRIAAAYAFRHQADEAFEWLDRAYALHDDDLIATKVDPFLKTLHNDPRYAALLKKLKLPN